MRRPWPAWGRSAMGRGGEVIFFNLWVLNFSDWARYLGSYQLPFPSHFKDSTWDFQESRITLWSSCACLANYPVFMIFCLWISMANPDLSIRSCHWYTYIPFKERNRVILAFARYYCQWPRASNNKMYGRLLSILGCQWRSCTCLTNYLIFIIFGLWISMGNPDLSIRICHWYTYVPFKERNRAILAFARYYCQWPWASNNKMYG